MAINSDFWIAAAAAAPIIALANQITLSDHALLAKALEMFRDDSSVDAPIGPGIVAILVLFLSYINLAFQGFALITALWSLAVGHDFGYPPQVWALVEGCGLSLVVITALGTAGARILSDRADGGDSPPEAGAADPAAERTS